MSNNIKQNAEFAVYKFFLPPMIYNICIKHTRQKNWGRHLAASLFVTRNHIYNFGSRSKSGRVPREQGRRWRIHTTWHVCVPHWFCWRRVIIHRFFHTHNTLSSTTTFFKNVPFKTTLEILAYICSTTPGDRGVRYYYYCINLSCCCCGNMRDEMCIITIVCV